MCRRPALVYFLPAILMMLNRCRIIVQTMCILGKLQANIFEMKAYGYLTNKLHIGKFWNMLTLKSSVIGKTKATPVIESYTTYQQLAANEVVQLLEAIVWNQSK